MLYLSIIIKKQTNKKAMKTYFKNSEEMKMAADKFVKEDTVLKRTSSQCDCGESFAISVININTLEDVFHGVECESCFNEYE